jgi:V8-like Glu-specific endopeptidase
MTIRPTLLTLIVLVPALLLAACSNQDAHTVVLPSFSDVSSAPPAIQTAGQAVVRIGTAGEIATGSFISPTGMLLTNNHVLGVSICPKEGCYAEIIFMYQRHSAVQKPQTVFVVPIAVDVGLDMAVVQVQSGPGGAPLDTPSYLTLSSRDAGSLRGMHIHVVGHPEGHLKKWTQGQVVDSDGTWITFTAYSLPGNSGSPILDDAGHLVGILHRGPTAQDLVSNSGIDEYSVGTASDALIQGMSAPLPPAMRSIAAPVTDDEVAQNQAVYLNARVQTAMVNGTAKPVLSSLGAQCDLGLARQDYASPDDLSNALAPCSQAELWIECRGDAAPGGFGVCPPDPDVWLQRYQDVYDHWRKLNGQLALDMVSFGPAALASSQAQGMGTGAQKLAAALSAANAPLDFLGANYLAAFNVDSYAGTRIVDFVRAYAKWTGYALSATEIASTALWLNHNGQLSGDGTRSFLETLAADDQVDVGTKLFIEDVLYRSGALD